MVAALHVLSVVTNDPDSALAPTAPSSLYDKETADGSSGLFAAAGQCTGSYPAGFSFLDEYSSYSMAADGQRTWNSATACKYVMGAAPGKDGVCYRCTPPKMVLASWQFA